MNPMNQAGGFFRVWVGRYSHWKPRRWSDVPPQAEAVEVADPRLLRKDEAHQVVEGFNQTMLRRGDRLWAIAVPVSIRMEGDPQRGQMLSRPTKGSSSRPNVRDTR